MWKEVSGTTSRSGPFDQRWLDGDSYSYFEPNAHGRHSRDGSSVVSPFFRAPRLSLSQTPEDPKSTRLALDRRRLASTASPEISDWLVQSHGPQNVLNQAIPAKQEDVSIINPPREAREGFEWVWFPAGYWAEREMLLASVPSSSKSSKAIACRLNLTLDRKNRASNSPGLSRSQSLKIKMPQIKISREVKDGSKSDGPSRSESFKIKVSQTHTGSQAEESCAESHFSSGRGNSLAQQSCRFCGGGGMKLDRSSSEGTSGKSEGTSGRSGASGKSGSLRSQVRRRFNAAFKKRSNRARPAG